MARQIAAIARHAYLTKQMEAVEQASQLLLALPISDEMKRIALYYEALSAKQKGNVEGALRSFEQVAQGAIPQYRARALQSIGAVYYEGGKVDEALPFYVAAGKLTANSDLLTLAESQCMIAVVRSIHGDHKQSLADLESVFPLVRAVGKFYPAFYYDYLNSLAVELGEASRIAEAQSAINISVGSPYSSVYGYWLETREEIEQKRNYPDPSRCFLDRSITESHPNKDSNTSLSPKTEGQTKEASSPQCQSEGETKPLREVAFHLFITSPIYQRALTQLNTSKLLFPSGAAQSFLLQRLGRCVQSRAPPCSLL